VVSHSYTQVIRLAAILIAGCPSLLFASEGHPGPRCTVESKTECSSRINASFNDASKYRNALKYCQVVRAACAREAAHRIALASERISAPEPSTSAPARPQKEDGSDVEQQLFVRADSLDNPYPGLTQSPSAGQSLGASIGYTGNNFVQSKSGSNTIVSSSQSVTSTGLATYLLTPVIPIGGYLQAVPAMWILANGNWDDPTKAFADTSALKIGPKAEFMLDAFTAGGVVNFFDLAPYYQTDFYGRAQAWGASASWTPVYNELFLGGVRTGSKPYAVDGFWELRAEATNLDVVTPGQTNFIKHDYQWLGGAARVYMFLFPTRGGMDWGPYLNDRVSFIGTVQSYRDASSSTTATLYSAALQYKLTSNTKGTDITPVGSTPDIGKKDPNTCAGGAATLTLQYDSGVDKDMLQEKKMLQLKLNYAY
jgi:hypothetical protein